MSTSFDFYHGRGPNARWLGSTRIYDRCSCLTRADFASAETIQEFAQEVGCLLEDAASLGFGDAHEVRDGWPWRWPTSHGTSLVYAFDKGTVWVSERGSPWRPAQQDHGAGMDDGAVPTHPVMREYCPIIGARAEETVHRRYGIAFTDTAHLDLQQVAVRFLSDRIAYQAHSGLPEDLHYAISTDETTATLTIEVFGLADTDPRATQTAATLREIADRYGWTDTAGGRPRFTTQVTILDVRTQQDHAHLRDTVRRADACYPGS
ncbi:hypothetical protein ACWEV3_40230 [Saccharopolyspora sp. NPDC003752]